MVDRSIDAMLVGQCCGGDHWQTHVGEHNVGLLCFGSCCGRLCLVLMCDWLHRDTELYVALQRQYLLLCRRQFFQDSTGLIISRRKLQM